MVIAPSPHNEILEPPRLSDNINRYNYTCYFPNTYFSKIILKVVKIDNN